MKFRTIGILAALMAIAVSVAVAGPKIKKAINLSEPTNVGSVTLPPGEYTIVWTGPGPGVQVSFEHRNNTVVTVPATLEAAHNQYDSVAVHTEDSGAQSLVEIRTKNSTLHFNSTDVISAK
jgi:hypothetical protein